MFNDNRQSGFAILLSVLVLGAVASSIVIGMLVGSIISSKKTIAESVGSEALFAADACVEEALQQLYANPSFSGSGNLTLTNSGCSYTVTNIGGSDRQIDATGTAGNHTRRIQVVVTAAAPQISITSWQEVVAF